MKINIAPFSNEYLGPTEDIIIETHDTWNLDTTLAKIILPALLQYRNAKTGSPSELSRVGGEDYEDQYSFDFYIESMDDSFNIGLTRWNTILDKMIWSFKQIALDDYSELYYIKNSSETGQSAYDATGHSLHEEQIQEGLDLFAKYYRSLWD